MTLRFAILLRRYSSGLGKEGQSLKIGNVQVPITRANRPEYVPAGHASLAVPAELTPHLKWLLQKHLLGQDVFLIGPPGRLRSQIVLQFLELCNEEYEWLSITRDSTEADIKQRREIRAGSAFYSDLSAVRAALEGRVLVIDGVEKAERNVLPILNNLLENREMQLDDGRFLMHHGKFDRLKEKYSERELSEMGLERVSPRFRVICLGLPVPRFPGFPLDPPLRSRFQSRNIPQLNFSTSLSACRKAAPSVPAEAMERLLSLCYALNAAEQLPFPHVPLDNLERVAAIWNTLPSLSAEWAFRLLYPLDVALSGSEQRRIGDFLTKFEVKARRAEPVAKLERSATGEMVVKVNGAQSVLPIPRVESSSSSPPSTSSTPFVSTASHEQALTELVAALAHGDAYLLGGRGCGKSSVARRVSRLLSREQRTLLVYQDMNSRELLQSRRMTAEGDTYWADSPLVEAARSGRICVIEGVDRLHHSALSALAPLLHHRRIHLPDGSKLVGAAEFREIVERTGFSPEEMNRRGVAEISESFRVLLVGDSVSAASPTDSSSSSRWLSSPLLSLAPFVTLRPLSLADQSALIRRLVPAASTGTLDTITKFAAHLAASHDPALLGVAPSLSLRRLIQIAKRDTIQPGQVRSLLERATLSRFAPQVTRRAFEAALEEHGIVDLKKEELDLEKELVALRSTGEAGVGDEALIPETLFYDNKQHTRVMCEMAGDFRLGEHLLLIGNQGVGKNKLTDRFLQLLARPRQYMQLHRDTTVESLTLRRVVEGGVVRSEDSALVAAARAGRVLVIDEADKASLHVVAVLKSLLDTGHLQLGDGRQIVPPHEYNPDNESHIRLHPEFRAILLANRPGFPFLGNDLFSSIGDLCAVHVIENPERSSEMQMLQRYAPDVPEETLSKLVSAFDDLRVLSDEGVLSYPYSTREIVSVVKHLNKFPSDSLSDVVGNVFDFDRYSEDRLETVQEVFRKHGIPLGQPPAAKRG